PTSKACAPCLIGLFIFMAFLAALPLLWYYAQNPADFFGRTSAISIFNLPAGKAGSANPLGQFSENVVKTLGMFNFAGDFNWRHNFAGSPQLWWPVGILFLIGIFGALCSSTLGVKSQKTPSVSPRNAYNFLFLWFGVMILPVALSNESLPHALRAIVLIPPAIIFAALGLDWFWENIRPRLRIFIFIFLAAATLQVYSQYFLRWAPNFNVYQAFQADITEKARWLNREPKEIKKYVITDSVDKVDTDGALMSFQPIVFITDTFYPKKQAEKNIYYISLKNLDSADCSQKCEFVPVEYRPTIFKIIKQKIPGLHLEASPGFVVLKNN
ncbi:MAG: hypothetical protein Q8Q46_04015, partial [Candidatus Giovannonibacteria bacterium]|nr:hypothetical protein [Candidatus Giovannonibacteria bacterium]